MSSLNASSAKAVCTRGVPARSDAQRARTSEPSGSADAPKTAAATNSVHVGAPVWTRTSSPAIPAACATSVPKITRLWLCRSESLPRTGAVAAFVSVTVELTAPASPYEPWAASTRRSTASARIEIG